MDKDTKIEEYRQRKNQYIVENLHASDVLYEVIDFVEKKYKEENGYTRQRVCEGIFWAAIDYAFLGNSDQHIQPPEKTRAFYKWAFEWLSQVISISTSPEAQKAYEKEYGEYPSWLFDKDTFTRENPSEDDTIN